LFMNSIVKMNLKKISDKYLWGQHPEAALRYSPVVKEIRNRGLSSSKIIEIGSGSLGITPYFKKRIVGLDIDFSGPKSKYLHKIKSEAKKIPFSNNSYDVSISVDVLEHIPPKNRMQSVSEQLRVTKKLSIIVVPCGQSSEAQDILLRKKWNKIFKEKNQFFEEHVNFGLPTKEEVTNYIEDSLDKLDKKAKITNYPNLNLLVRSFLMNTWITNNKFFYYLYLKGYLVFLPILKKCNFGKTYRQVFVIKFLPRNNTP